METVLIWKREKKKSAAFWRRDWCAADAGAGKAVNTGYQTECQLVMGYRSETLTSISEMAKAVEAGGADAISLINTLTG